MNIRLKPELEKLNQQALQASRLYKDAEAHLIEVLIQVDAAKLYKWLGCESLFKYTVNVLGHSESVAYNLISVARKSREVPQLLEAIKHRKLSAAKASRIVSALSPANASELIEFAVSHSTREVDFEMARLRPKDAVRDQVRPVSENFVQVKMGLANQTLNQLKRVQSLIASKGRKAPDFDAALSVALGEYIERHDPVVKAQRVANKKTKQAVTGEVTYAPNGSSLISRENPEAGCRVDHAVQNDSELCAHRVAKSVHRKPITAEQKHSVFLRDGGRCTFRGADGKRCETDRWLHLHHVIPVSAGGTNEPENLTTLCSFHHDLVHQLSFPLENQTTWLRERAVGYDAS